MVSVRMKPYQNASSTWVKHDEGNMKKEAGFNKLQIREYVSAIKITSEGPKDADNELQVWDDSLKNLESTRQTIRDKAGPIRGKMQGSDEILGLSVDPGFKGLCQIGHLNNNLSAITTQKLCVYLVELINKINEGIYEIGPGNCGDEGFEPVASESCLKLAFFPESVANVFIIINKIERKKRGYYFGSRRLTLIKRAARRKHVIEISRMDFEDNMVVERAIDPYGFYPLMTRPPLSNKGGVCLRMKLSQGRILCSDSWFNCGLPLVTFSRSLGSVLLVPDPYFVLFVP
ncbi:hypothetical protein GQ457_07G005240 [Hibiscus cannabinus]